MVFTYHTYPDLLHTSDRLARTDWETNQPHCGVAATIKLDPNSIVLNVRSGFEWLKGLAPGGINVIGADHV